MQDNYLNAYAALAKKKQEDDAAATAIAPTEGEREGVKDQSSLAALVGSLMKAQAGMGSIGGKATANPDINYGQYADINSKDLLARRAKSDDMLRLSDKAFQGGRQSISDSMGAKQFSDQQAQAPLDLAQKQFKFDSMQAEAPINLQQKKAELELTKQQILQGGKNPNEVDKELFKIMQADKYLKTADMLQDSDPQKADALRLKYNEVMGGKAPTEGQASAAIYAQRADEAQKQLQQLKADGYDATGLSKAITGSGLFPNALKSSEQQMQEQAQRNFVNAVLRKESGAVISDSEFDNARKQYFPTPGDASDVLGQKQKNIDDTVAGLRASAGPKARENVRGQLPSKKTMTSDDMQALEWAKANSNDPRAAKIIMKLQGN